jgi:hypothetical protein
MFFKDTENTRVQEIRKYIPVSVATTFANIKPLIANTESKYILSLLGQTLYDQVLSYYTNPESQIDGITEDNKGKFDILITHIQRALINLTYFSDYEFLSVSMNDSGFHRTESDTNKTLYKYQEEALKNQFKNSGFSGLDTILEYLESLPAVFPLYANSANYTTRKSSIIPNTAVFNQYVNIGNSRLVFLKLCPFIEETEDFEIKAALGLTLFELVKTEIVKTSPAAKISALLPLLRKTIAHTAMSKGFQRLGFQIKDRGVFLASLEATNSNSLSEKPIPDSHINLVVTAEKKTGEYYLAALREFLVQNADTYTEITRTTGDPFIRNNTDKTSYWV